jgi:hypothetical protein
LDTTGDSKRRLNDGIDEHAVGAPIAIEHGAPPGDVVEVFGLFECWHGVHARSLALRTAASLSGPCGQTIHHSVTVAMAA